jgi:hypothetical protein
MNPIAIGTAAGAAAFTLGSSALAAAGRGLSFAAELARGANAPTASQQSSSPWTSTPASGSAVTNSAADALRQRIALRLFEAGVQLSQPVTLISNGQGGIAVAGAHPQQAQIEEAVGSDLLLEHDFNLLANQAVDLSAVSSDGIQPAGFSVTISPPGAGMR